MTNIPPENPEPNKKEEPPKNKFGFDNKFYANANTRDTVAYVIMIVGIIITIFHPFYGGLIVGIVWGLYFSDEVLSFIRSANRRIEAEGMVRSLIGGGLLITLFILAPSVFIGAALAVAVKQIIITEPNKTP